MPKIKVEMEIEKTQPIATSTEMKVENPLPKEAPVTPVKTAQTVPVKPNNQKKLFDFFSKK
jgi:hypothetical protein